MPRAIHRFHSEFLLLDVETKHVFFIVRGVATGFPQIKVINVRRHDFVVLVFPIFLSNKLNQSVVNLRAVFLEKAGPRTESVEKKQLLVHPDQSVVSLLRLFNPSRVFFHQLIVRKRHRVHSHQWIFRHVRSPMRPRTLRHF